MDVDFGGKLEEIPTKRLNGEESWESKKECTMVVVVNFGGKLGSSYATKNSQG